MPDAAAARVTRPAVSRRGVLAVAARDLRLVMRGRALTVPVIALSTVLLIVPPVALLLAVDSGVALSAELASLLTRLPERLVSDLPGNADRRAVVLLLVYIFAPLYLALPVLVAGLTAADSVIGERERGTLEQLLHSPTTDRELLIGKLLVPWGVAMVVAVVGALIYGTVANITLIRLGLPRSFPNATWTVLVLWVVPAAAGLAVALVVAVATRLSTFAQASRMAGIVVLPIVGLVVAQVAGIVLFEPLTLAALGGVTWLLTLLLLRVSGRRFSRDQLLARG